MDLPMDVFIYEVGPREGVQIASNPISTEDKVSFINALSETGLKSIETVSFVSPKWVPNMADADDVLVKLNKKPEVAYRTIYLNVKGLERALGHQVTIDGVVNVSASDIFSRKNNNRSTEELLDLIPSWIEVYQNAGIPVDQLAIMAAFGCNYEGHVPLERVLDLITKVAQLFQEHGEKLKKLKLADTMGWANPEQIKRTVTIIKEKWPDMEIILHLHDTRGLGLANAYAALKEGVRHFESAVGGLGGCPFAKVKGAPGNICTEDLVFMCEEMGVKTGIDLDKLLECVNFAEKIFGHGLPGHLSRGGLFREIRQGTWSQFVHF